VLVTVGHFVSRDVSAAFDAGQSAESVQGAVPSLDDRLAPGGQFEHGVSTAEVKAAVERSVAYFPMMANDPDLGISGRDRALFDALKAAGTAGLARD